MEHLTVKLVWKDEKQSFYKLNHKLVVGLNKYHLDLINSLQFAKTLHADEPAIEMPTDGVDIICVSDAMSHAERIVFSAIPFDDYYTRTNVILDGKFTALLYGGESSTVHKPAYYLKRLAKANGYVFDQSKDLDNTL